MKEHFRWHFAYSLPCKVCVPNDPASPSEINQHFSFRVVHWQGKSIPGHAAFVGQCFCKCFAESDARVFYGMMLVNMKVAVCPDRQIHLSMSGNLVEHMIKKAKTSDDV